jgi:hypothetical protein
LGFGAALFQIPILNIQRVIMSHKFFDLTFTESVKQAQQKYGSRRNYARFEGGKSDFYGLGDAERGFIEERDGFYMATVNSQGQPYIQFRGGAKGFLKVLDDKTLGFADFSRQYAIHQRRQCQ